MAVSGLVLTRGGYAFVDGAAFPSMAAESLLLAVPLHIMEWAGILVLLGGRSYPRRFLGSGRHGAGFSTSPNCTGAC